MWRPSTYNCECAKSEKRLQTVMWGLKTELMWFTFPAVQRLTPKFTPNQWAARSEKSPWVHQGWQDPGKGKRHMDLVKMSPKWGHRNTLTIRCPFVVFFSNIYPPKRKPSRWEEDWDHWWDRASFPLLPARPSFPTSNVINAWVSIYLCQTWQWGFSGLPPASAGPFTFL